MGIFIDLSAMNVPDDSTILKNFGKSLEKYRKLRGMSQRDLAAIVYKEQAQIARYEQGKVNPTILTVFRLAAALEIDPSDLLTFDK